MDYIEIRLPKCVVHLTSTEIHRMLLQDPDLFSLALKRSKGIVRHREQKTRENQKWERERGY